MNFTFLHASDLHLGSPLIGLTLKDENVAKQFAAASRLAFTDLVTRAVELKIAFVVFAGDIHDSEGTKNSRKTYYDLAATVDPLYDTPAAQASMY